MQGTYMVLMMNFLTEQSPKILLSHEIPPTCRCMCLHAGVCAYMQVYVTVFRKTNRSVRKSIIAYVRKYTFEHEDANGKEERFTRRRSFGLASSLDGGIFAQRKGTKQYKSCFFLSLTGWFS